VYTAVAQEAKMEIPALKMPRREFLITAAGAGAAAMLPASGQAQVAAQSQSVAMADEARQENVVRLLLPQQNAHRNLMELGGFWQFQLDPEDAGAKGQWHGGLPSPRLIAVPSSWNDIFDDAANYLGPAWYLREVWVPAAWRGRRVFLYFGSVNYTAEVWINGAPLGGHLGGHLPFAFDVTSHLAWERANLIAVRAENIQTTTRVPPGGETRGFFTGYPATHYDFFPYAGIERQVQLVALPEYYIEDVTVTTKIEGAGVVSVKAQASGEWSGTGKVQLGMGAGAIHAPLDFSGGRAEATLRVPGAVFWSPETPHLYPLQVTLAARDAPLDSYSLDIGIRTIEVRGPMAEDFLLNGKPIFLKGFSRHEDFPISGRGLNLPVTVRDAELLKWVGANSFRTSHYPYSPECMELADRYGFLVIDEIPAVGMTFSDGEANIQKRLDQCLRDIDDLVARDKNHPSVIAWSVANEPGLGSIAPGHSRSDAVAAGAAFFTELLGHARQLDSRPATFTTVQGGPFEWTALCDFACLNAYFGWYSYVGRLDEAAQAFGEYLDHAHDVVHKPIVITECGASAIAGDHDTPPRMWTEEYQAEFLRHYLEVVGKRSYMAGIHVWNFHDLKTPQSIIRAEGENNKGVFTRVRRPKMAAHFLRSRWNPKA
jgi:beta-galactosidase/beta-glucuronidase